MQSRTGWLFGILLLAFVLRGATAMVLQWQLDRVKRLDLIEGDASGYLLLADRIVNGESYEIYSPPRRVLRMPGFPVLLAFVRLFTDSLLHLRLALCVVGTVACGLVYWLGRELVSVDVGLAAAGLGAVSPIFVGFTPLILSETLFAATLVASLIPLAPLFQRHMAVAKAAVPIEQARGLNGVWLSSIAGLLFGMACYVRPSWLLAAPMFAGLLILVSADKGRATVHGAVLLAAMILSLLPWGLRNRAVTGHFVLTTLWSGPSLYDGLHPGATGESDMGFYDRDNLLSKMSEYDVNRNYSQAAWKFVRENPGRTFDLALIKFGRFWKPWPSAPQFDRWWAKAAVAMWFVPLIVLALIGISRLRDNWPALVLCVSPIVYFTAIHLLFVSSLRYRLPAEYPLLVPAAVGLLACVKWQRSRGRQPRGHQFTDRRRTQISEMTAED